MRAASLALLAFLATSASADRLIDIPTARKLKYMWFRFEYVDGVSSNRTQLSYLDMGIGTNWEATVRTQQIDYGPSAATLDLTYNYISPIPGLSPGLAAGVQDVLNKAQDGRRPFVCATWSEPGQAMGGEVMDDITLGIYYRNRPYGFVGTSIPFSKQFRLIAEHNGDRLSAGFELRPIPILGLRFFVRGTDTLMSASLLARF